jgi:hypothetical protein
VTSAQDLDRLLQGNGVSDWKGSISHIQRDGLNDREVSGVNVREPVLSAPYVAKANARGPRRGGLAQGRKRAVAFLPPC